jgi:acyl carrier protein
MAESDLADLQLDLKRLIIDALKLEGIQPDQIDASEPLFGEGLGLDSIDALELGVAIRKTYKIRIESVTDEVKAHFRSVESLARFIHSQAGSAGEQSG